MRFYLPFELPSDGKLIMPHQGYIGDAEGLEELERATPGINQDQIIAQLIQKALKENYFDVRDLTSPDFTYLKIMYSIATFGNKLLYPMLCPYCGHEIKFISLRDLKKIKYEPSDLLIKKIPSKESREFYAEDGDLIEIRLPSIQNKWDVLALKDTARATIMAVVNSIEKINDKVYSALDREYYTQELSVVQKRVILARVDKLADFGISIYQDTVCDCGKIVSYPFSIRTRQLYFPELG
jgi:hypothetical protein